MAVLSPLIPLELNVEKGVHVHSLSGRTPKPKSLCALSLFYLKISPYWESKQESLWTNKEKLPLNHLEDPIEANGEESGDPVRYPLLTLEKAKNWVTLETSRTEVG